MKQFCINAIETLQVTSDYGKSFVNLRMEFHRKHGHGLITSTWHGSDFFANLLFCLNGGDMNEWKDKEPNGDYKKNFEKLVQIGLKESI